MKTLYYFIIVSTALLLSTNYSLSQSSYNFLNENSEVITGETITITGETTDSRITFNYKVSNTTDEDIVSRIEKEYIDIIDGAYTTFCFPGGMCLAPGTFLSPTFTLEANETSSTNEIEYFVEGLAGTSIVRHKIFNNNNAEDYAYFDIKYVIEGDNTVKPVESKEISIFPNPAVDNFKVLINSKEFSRVKIYNVLGKNVKELNINKNMEMLNVNCSSWDSGLYFIQFINDADNTYKIKRLSVKTGM